MSFKVRILLIILITLFSKTFILGQYAEKQTIGNPPINMETLVGYNGLFYQLLVVKKISSLSRFGFFSVSNLITNWEPRTDSIMSQGKFTYSVLKGLDITGGFMYTSVNGLRTSTGLIYTLSDSNYTVIMAPSVDVSKNANAEVMLMTEYIPSITDKLRLYTRFQGMHSVTINSGLHDRSYVMLRLGLRYKEFSFGTGVNLDWYGPMKKYDYNVGAFININLF
ncbi:hypothetical protein [Chryseobacterium sp. LAM-KRS1]|uniref:hypothetical protein n=1 Tax=Chryseobacterium sp. LAM-KRS1 TaxID=2715754 RepID=UPI0015529429|nr:hypothetical protein [Chryseobacterium sp. LAM-KRS1]